MGTRYYSRYKLLDENRQEFALLDPSFRRSEDVSEIEVETVERSFRAGAEFPGVARDMSKEITFSYDLNKHDEQLYRARENLLRYNFRKIRWIQDTINNIETEVIFSSSNIAYDDGGQFLGSKNEVRLKQLRPYWWDIEYNSETESGFSSGTLVIDETDQDGWIETPPIITLDAYEPCTKFSIRVLETGHGIFIQDLQFGSNGLNTYIIDNNHGYAELNMTDRNSKIRGGTGFFLLQPRAKNTLIFELNGQCDALVQWKRRVYL
jgi:hypothetical protein